MTTLTPALTTETIHYPESDGQPIADNTRQFRWIVIIKDGLEAMFREQPDVFVAGDLFWYPVEGKPQIRRAPDVMVVFGRPKGDRGSYLQWQEDGLAPQVVFEILSPGNTLTEMAEKFEFYDRYGVQEYYLYDPDTEDLSGWQRNHERLQVIRSMAGWVSPQLGIRFEPDPDGLTLYRPDGGKFESYIELVEKWEQERQRAERLAAQLRALGIEPEV